MKEYEYLTENAKEYEYLYNISKIKYMIMEKLEEEKSVYKIVDKLKEKNIYIYGAGTIGKKLYKILINYNEIKILGFIERDRDNGDNIISLKHSNEKINPEAIIIITPIDYYNEIMKDINSSGLDNKVFSILELL